MAEALALAQALDDHDCNAPFEHDECAQNQLITALFHRGPATDAYETAVSTFNMPHFNMLRFLSEAHQSSSVTCTIGEIIRKALPHRGMYRVFERGMKHALSDARVKRWVQSALLWSLHGRYAWNNVDIPCWRRYQLYEQFVVNEPTSEWLVEHGRLLLFAVRERITLLVANDGPLRAALDKEWIAFENDTIAQMNEVRQLTARQGVQVSNVLRRRSIRRPRTFNVVFECHSRIESTHEHRIRTLAAAPLVPKTIRSYTDLLHQAQSMRRWLERCGYWHAIQTTDAHSELTMEDWQSAYLSEALWFQFWAKSVVLVPLTADHRQRQLDMLRARHDLTTDRMVRPVILYCLHCQTSKHNVPKLKKKPKNVADCLDASNNLAFGHRDVLWDANDERVLCLGCTKKQHRAIGCIHIDITDHVLTIDERTYGVCEGCGSIACYDEDWLCEHCAQRRKMPGVCTHCHFCMVKSNNLTVLTVYNDLDAHIKRTSPWEYVSLCNSHSYGLKVECVYLKSNIWTRLKG